MRNLLNDFLEKSKLVHGDKYDYSLVEYKTNKIKVKIICPEHGIFEQVPNWHTSGSKCPKCAKLNRISKMSMTQDNFIKNANKRHNNKYDYSLVEYKNSKTKIKIICPEHGVFEQKPGNHISGQNCPSCGFKMRRNKLTYTNKDFIKKSKIIHKNKYDYSKVIYKTSRKKVDIICPIHGLFSQVPVEHMQGAGCNKCAINSNTNNRKIKTSKSVLNFFYNTHLDRYDYSKVEYIDAKTKVEIICKKHGSFYQKPHNHINGQGCPSCMNSKGVNKICSLLRDNKINYKREQVIKGCVSEKKYPLKFDVFIPEYNTYIEYDGAHHFIPIEVWGGMQTYKKTKIRDKIKNDFCQKNNLKLYRISYKDDIDRKMNEILISIKSSI